MVKLYPGNLQVAFPPHIPQYYQSLTNTAIRSLAAPRRKANHFLIQSFAVLHLHQKLVTPTAMTRASTVNQPRKQPGRITVTLTRRLCVSRQNYILAAAGTNLHCRGISVEK